MFPNQDDKLNSSVNDSQANIPPEPVSQPTPPVSSFEQKTEPPIPHIASGQPAVNPIPTPTEEHVFKPQVFTPAMAGTNIQSDQPPVVQPLTQQPMPPAVNQPTSAQAAGQPMSSNSDVIAVNMPNPTPVFPPKKRNFRLLTGVPILIVILLAGLFATYSEYYLPSQPVNIVKQSLVNMINGNSFSSFQFNSSFSYTEKSSDQTFSGTLNGSAAQSGKFTADLSVDAVVTDITVNLESTDGHELYVKVGGLGGLPQLLGTLGTAYGLSSSESSSIDSIINTINNQWFEVNQSMLQDAEKSIKSTSGNLNIGSLTQTEANTIGSLYHNYPFLTVQKTLPMADIDGLSSYHYQVVISSNLLKSYIGAIQKASIKDVNISENDVTSIDNTINKANFNKYPFDIWISESSKLIDQVSIQGNDTSGNSFSFSLTLGHFNQPVTVTTPANTESVLQLIGQLPQELNSLLSGSSSGITSNPLNLFTQTL